MKVCAVFEPDGKGGFGVYFPGLPGCVSLGDTLDKARKMAREAVTDHLALLVADGERVSPKVGLSPGRTPKGCTVEVLEIPAAAIHARIPAMRRSIQKARHEHRSSYIRLNITVPEDLVARADVYARRHGRKRSRLIAEALESVLDKGD